MLLCCTHLETFMSTLERLLGTPNEDVWPGVSKLMNWHEYPQWKTRFIMFHNGSLKLTSYSHRVHLHLIKQRQFSFEVKRVYFLFKVTLMVVIVLHKFGEIWQAVVTMFNF